MCVCYVDVAESQVPLGWISVIDELEHGQQQRMRYDDIKTLALANGLPSSPSMDLHTETDCLLKFLHNMLVVMVSHHTLCQSVLDT